MEAGRAAAEGVLSSGGFALPLTAVVIIALLSPPSPVVALVASTHISLSLPLVDCPLLLLVLVWWWGGARR